MTTQSDCACDVARKRGQRAGFTLIELMFVITIISILLSVVWTVGKGLRKRAERVACGANLTTLHIALQSYVDEIGYWPQVPVPDNDEEKYWEAWRAKLARYEVADKNWLCPSHLRVMRDVTEPYSSYLPNNFDGTSRMVPHKWRMPWLVEIGDNHGDGPLVIYPDGSIDTTVSLENPETSLERR